jgi:hypothetical protein
MEDVAMTFRETAIPPADIWSSLMMCWPNEPVRRSRPSDEAAEADAADRNSAPPQQFWPRVFPGL